MSLNRSLVVALAGAAALGGSTGFGIRIASADNYPTVTANIDITSANKSPVRDDAIPSVAVDPNDSHHIVVAQGDFRTGTCLIHVSTDGGATFTAAKLSPAAPQFEHCTPNAGANSFPMAWGKDGALLIAQHAFNGTATVFGGPVNIVVSRTTNFGNDWQYVVAKRNGPNATPEPSAAPPTPQLQPSENATATPTPSTTPAAPAAPQPEGAFGIHLASDRNGNVVVGWQARNVTVPGVSKTESRAQIAVSTDDGKTFGSPIDVAGLTANSLPTSRGPSLAFAPDGTLYMLVQHNSAPKGSPATAKPALVMYRTSDLGKTIQSTTIQPTTSFTSYPEVAVSPGTGGSGYSVVAVFEDLSDDPAALQQQVRDIFYSRSTDKGGTFSPRARLTDDPIATDFANKYVPGISAAPNGRLDAAWADFRDDDGHLTSNTYYTSSSDGGATWSKNLRISSQGSNRHYGQFANYSDVRGPVGVASDNYGAYISWDDTRNATDAAPAQDVYFAAVQQAAIPVSSSYNAVRVVGAVVGGLFVTGVSLTLAALLLRRRRTSATAGA